jgi:hypothetical protein
VAAKTQDEHGASYSAQSNKVANKMMEACAKLTGAPNGHSWNNLGQGNRTGF